MRLRIGIAALLMSTAVIMGAAPGNAATTGSDVKGPACADIIDGAGFYDGTTVYLRITLAAPSCPKVSYTLYVVDEVGSTTPIAVSSQLGDGTSTQLTYAVPVPANTDSTVCVYSTTTKANNGKLYDRAPDEGCADFTVDGPPAGRPYR